MGEIRDYSTTASSNTFATSEGGMPEAMDYRDVNDSARVRMAALRRFLEDNNGTLQATTPSANVYELTPNAETTPVTGSPVRDGLTYAFTVDEANTGTATLQSSDGTTVIGPYEVWANDTLAAALAGDLRLNAVHYVTLKQISGTWRWLLLNSVAGVNSEIETINATSDQPLFVYNTAQVEDNVHIGVQPGDRDQPNLVLGATLVGNWPLLIRDQANEPASASDAQQFGIGLMHGLINLLGFFGFFTATQGTSTRLRMHNNIPNGGLALSTYDGTNYVTNEFNPNSIVLRGQSGARFDLTSSGGFVLRNSDLENGLTLTPSALTLGEQTITSDLYGSTTRLFAGASASVFAEGTDSAATFGDNGKDTTVRGDSLSLTTDANSITVNSADDVTVTAADNIALTAGTANTDRIEASKLLASPTEVKSIDGTLTLTASDVGKVIVCEALTSISLAVALVCDFDPGYDGAVIEVFGRPVLSNNPPNNFLRRFTSVQVKYGSSTATYSTGGSFVSYVRLVWVESLETWRFNAGTY